VFMRLGGFLRVKKQRSVIRSVIMSRYFLRCSLMSFAASLLSISASFQGASRQILPHPNPRTSSQPKSPRPNPPSAFAQSLPRRPNPRSPPFHRPEVFAAVRRRDFRHTAPPALRGRRE
jgi:hypothetical protein